MNIKFNYKNNKIFNFFSSSTNLFKATNNLNGEIVPEEFKGYTDQFLKIMK